MFEIAVQMLFAIGAVALVTAVILMYYLPQTCSKVAKKEYRATVDCVTLQTGKYSLAVSENSVDVVVTIPMLKLISGMVTDGKLLLQFSDVSEHKIDEIFRCSRDFQKKMNELFEPSK